MLLKSQSNNQWLSQALDVLRWMFSFSHSSLFPCFIFLLPFSKIITSTWLISHIFSYVSPLLNFYHCIFNSFKIEIFPFFFCISEYIVPFFPCTHIQDNILFFLANSHNPIRTTHHPKIQIPETVRY